MTRVFLAAGVAALAIAAPASGDPHGNKGGAGQPALVNHGGGGGGQHAQRAERGGGGGRATAGPQMERQSFAGPRMQRAERFASAERPQRAEHVQMRAEQREARPQRTERAPARVAERQQARTIRVQSEHRVAERQQGRVNRAQAQNRVRANRVEQAQNSSAERVRTNNRVAERQKVQANSRMAARLQAQGNNRMAERQQVQANGRMAERQQFGANRMNEAQNRMAMRQQFGNGGQNGSANLLAERHALRADRIANADAFRTSRFASLVDTPQSRVIAPAEAVRFVGQPVNRVNNFVTLSALPASVSYLYPATPNYYYQYGGGYLYQVDRSSLLVDALIPLLAGGFLPGTYLPQPYMASYVPSYYGLNSFYPASYAYGYGPYGYSNICNRYAYGVVYQVDCVTGMVVNVIPTYAGGYGVGQMLPSAYSYYNVPMQYRDMYYPTADISYWYAPGAIYQYDRRSSLITSVAALMSPGFTVGQPLPVGYGMYNVPMAYRATYYDTPNAWYRYNNGYIYQVDPATMLVTAMVASALG
jgi:hypothetical protein